MTLLVAVPFMILFKVVHNGSLKGAIAVQVQNFKVQGTICVLLVNDQLQLNAQILIS